VIQGEDLREWLISDYSWVDPRSILKAPILGPSGRGLEHGPEFRKIIPHSWSRSGGPGLRLG